MKLSTRLLLPLLAAVTLVMVAYATWSFRQREVVMRSDAERETRAYATALGLALERAIGQGDPASVEEMMERIDREPRIYGVFVYDTAGAPRYVSTPLSTVAPLSAAEVRSVLEAGVVRTVRRELEGESAMTVTRPLLDERGSVRGALEVVQPLGSAETQLVRAQLRFVLNTITLLLAVTLLLTWLVRRHLSEPLARFVGAVRALGAGDLSHRVETTTEVGELAEVAGELNRMADRLEEAQRRLVQEGEDRVALERRLSQSEKLAEVGRLAAGLAHEIGAPLNVIRGRAELARKADAGAVTRERNLNIIVQQIDRITLIVRNLLGYTRRREPRPVECNLVGIVRAVLEFVDSEAQRSGTRLLLEADEDRIDVHADPDLLHQVFLNVVLNALHAIGEADHGGALVVRVGRETLGGRECAVVEIEDDGPGIPAEIRERVFDAFFTTKIGSGGTGLGLALARGIVEDHGGGIALRPPSSNLWSTRLRIELPLEAAGAAPTTEVRRNAPLA